MDVKTTISQTFNHKSPKTTDKYVGCSNARSFSIPDNVVHIVILDISGIYAQIYNQGYFDNNTIDTVKQQYSDLAHWKVVVIE